MTLLHLETLIPFSVLLASLAGSAHCATMCGGIVSIVGQNKKDLIQYHLGRLLGYLSLGALAGFIGQNFFHSHSNRSISLVSGLLLGIFFLYLSYQSYQGKTHLFKMPQFLAKVFQNNIAASNNKVSSHKVFSAGLCGVLSVFLPCGWLYSFIAGALATSSAIQGALFLFVFWLGTIPALSITPYVMQNLITPLRQKSPKISALILLLLSLLTISVKLIDWSHPGLGLNWICIH